MSTFGFVPELGSHGPGRRACVHLCVLTWHCTGFHVQGYLMDIDIWQLVQDFRGSCPLSSIASPWRLFMRRLPSVDCSAQAPSPASARILILTVCSPHPPRPTCLQVLWYKKFSCDVGNCPTAVVLNWYPAYRCVEVRRNQPSGSFVFERVRGAHVSGGLQGVRGACNIYSTSYFRGVSCMEALGKCPNDIEAKSVMYVLQTLGSTSHGSVWVRYGFRGRFCAANAGRSEKCLGG